MCIKDKINNSKLVRTELNESGYIREIYSNNYMCSQHRRIAEEYFGEIPDGWEIHHINRIRTDNRIENLLCLPREEHRRVYHGFDD